MNTTENNKLTAEFMGWWNDGNGNYKVDNVSLNMGFKRVKEMRFDYSWDWLMPVVEKCLSTEEPEEGQHRAISERLKETDIEMTYSDVVHFIQLHNQNKSTKKTFRVHAEVTTFCYIDIEAESIDEANEKAEGIDGGDFTTSSQLGDFDIQTSLTSELNNQNK